ncbi:hypothetical protein [Actinomadura kijaniata]|uniref:hypothetical protein n=1 Tax=Actinomadura kijaniata TaxID=46161 RepID=UPI00082A5D0C|nr:hypothetical protein [Actinomadura kijaniata]
MTQSPSGDGSGLRMARLFDAVNPDGSPAVRRPQVPEEFREAVLRYLDEAPIVLAARSYDEDVLDPERTPRVPLTFHTDGAWIWPGAVSYYLSAHGVPPEPELVNHIGRNAFRLPEVGEDARRAAVATITSSPDFS